MVHMPFMGLAVHAVLPKLRTAQDFDYENLLAEVEATEHRVKSPFGHALTTLIQPTFDAAQRTFIFEAWDYLRELVSHPEHVWVEPRVPGGKRPDLVMVHQNRVYVVDVKTTSRPIDIRTVPHFSWDPYSYRAQISHATWNLMQQLPPGLQVVSYALLFFPLEPSHEPYWLQLDQLITR